MVDQVIVAGVADPGRREPATAVPSSYVDWAAVFAGAVVALAVSFVLLTFGAAVGLSAVSPWTSTRGSVASVSFGAAVWLILVHVWAFGLGGYIAARMRHRFSGVPASEVAFRDGAHGVVVWAIAVTVAAAIAALSAVSAAGGAARAAAQAATDPVSMATSTLLRPATVTATTPVGDVRADVAVVVARSTATGEISPADRTYLASVVAGRTGLAQPEAERRVNETIIQLKAAVDRARKVAVVLGFLVAATLLLGAAAAWWGASEGGKHRDQGTIWLGLSSRAFNPSRQREDLP